MKRFTQLLVVGLALCLGRGAWGAHLDNVVAFWDLASNSTDQSGNSHTGTDTSMSYNGTKATFNGSTSFISVTGIATGGTTYTISVWVNGTVSVSGQYVCILTDSAGNFGLFTFTSAGVCKADLYSGGDHLSSTALSNSTLYHLVVSVNAGTATFYVNGSSAGTSASIGSGTFSRIGYDSSDIHYSGTMQSLALYSDAKDSTWVTAEYNSGTPKKYADWSSTPTNTTNFFQFMHAPANRWKLTNVYALAQ